MLYAQVLTLFPSFFDSPLACSIPKRAIAKGLVRIECIDIRAFARDKHRTVDDRPFGGGPGMVMKPDVVVAAIRKARANDPYTRVVMLSPDGVRFTQRKAEEYASLQGLALLCGRYEGFDARVEEYVDERLSVGDYVLSGGEPAALVVLDAVIRLLPGALGCEESARQESFSQGEDWLDWPQYTHPVDFEGRIVPAVLRSGHHAKIEQWRIQQAKRRARARSQGDPR